MDSVKSATDGTRLAWCFGIDALTTVLMSTDAGDITLEMFDQDAPNTVANFVKLAKEGFYDGLAFHRVIDGFMAQGGCPNSREGSRGMPGTGGPGYMIDCEINSKKHVPGALSMAHAGKNTGGSQFFIVHEAQPHLDACLPALKVRDLRAPAFAVDGRSDPDLPHGAAPGVKCRPNRPASPADV